jgi:signal transduction histidine kinase
MRKFFGPWVSARTYAQLAYLALAFPLGLAYFVFLVTGISVGAGLVIVWVGVPILLGMLLSWRALGGFERFLHRQLLGVEIDEPFTSIRGEGSLWQRTKSLLTDAVTWRTLLWLFIRFPAGIFVFVVMVTSLAITGSLIGFGAGAVLGLDFAEWGKVFEGENFFDSIDERFALPAGLALLSLQPHVVRGLAWFHAVAGTALLGPSVRERERVLQARTTVLEERTKLAHELHDAVGHTVTLMTVQAGAGRKVFDTDPAFARSSLGTIEESGRRALAELDHILGLLREDEGGGSAPAAGLDRLPDLVREVGDAGLVATLEVTGEPHPLPQGLDSSAYRIVQEALTNVLKHAAAAPATIRVDHQPDALVIEVIDDGPRAGPAVTDRAGHGLVGIRERAAVFGAEIEVGPRPESGYRVWVRFPLNR